MIKRTHALWASWGVAAGALIVTAAACGSDDDSINLTSHDGDAGTDSPSLVPDGFFPTDDAGPDQDASPGFTCSVDLHDVYDPDGNFVRTCPPDQGCERGTGKCVSACDSSQSNQSGFGCEYYSVQPDGSGAYGICYAVMIENTWNAPVTITAEMDGTPYKMDDFARIPSGTGTTMTYLPLPGGQLQPNQVALLFLSGVACPDGVITPNGSANTTGTMMGTAFHITTDHPVSAHDIFPYGWATAAISTSSLLFPTSAWDDNYLAIDQFTQSTLNPYPEALQIVAQADSTVITVLTTADVAAANGVAAAPKNVPTNYTIDKGEVLSLTNMEGLSGTIIKSSKPVGAWSSVGCFNIPANARACDDGHTQMPPMRALGSEYVVARYRNRRPSAPDEAPPWRIMGLVDGTALSYEPAAPTGAPTTIKTGEIVTFNAAGPFVIKSQDEDHPFYVSQHMTGCGADVDGGDCIDGLGDPESMEVVPAKQLLSSYTFFTDPSYSEVNMVVIRSKGTGGAFKDVTLDCVGNLTGWTAIGTSGKYEYTRVDLVTGGAGVHGCDNGTHTIRSDAPFGATVWGWLANTPDVPAAGVSYGFPTGLSVRPLNEVVINPVPH